MIVYIQSTYLQLGAAPDDPGAIGATVVQRAVNPIIPFASILFGGAGVCSDAVFDASQSRGMYQTGQ